MRKVFPLVVLMFAVTAMADDALPVSGTADVIQRLPQQSESATVRAVSDLFQARSEAVTVVNGMRFVEPPPDVLIAKVDGNGRVVTACVTSPEAAAAFVARRREADTVRQDQ